MKKLLLFAIITSFVLITSCNNSEESKEKTHQHDDGSTHKDHDTTKPAQQEFNVADTTKKDTTKHSHADGEKHSH